MPRGSLIQSVGTFTNETDDLRSGFGVPRGRKLNSCRALLRGLVTI